MMKDLIRKMTGALPDWLNPVYVKELRQTLHSKSFLVVSILIVLTELLMWNSAREQLANGIWETEDFAGTLLYALLFYVWLLGSVAFLQPAISRWIEERNLDAVSPERTTCLSVRTILSGKLQLHVTLLVWCAILCLPLFFWLYPMVETALLQKYFCTAGISFLLILNLTVWSTIVSMNMRIRRNVTGGLGFFGWMSLSIGTVFILLYQGIFLAIFDLPEGVAQIFSIIIFTLLILLIYGVLLLVSVMRPVQCNRMFPARAGGYVLCLLTVICGYIAAREWGEKHSELVTCSVLILICGYISFQSVIAVFEQKYMPERMALDAPKNMPAKAVWYLCGSGLICAWSHLLIPFAAVSALFLADRFDESIIVFPAMLLMFVSYAVIYSAVVCLIRIRFPKWNGGIVLLVLFFTGWFADVILTAGQAAEYAYCSPLFYCFRQFFELLFSRSESLNDLQQNVVIFSKTVTLVAWGGIFLMLAVSAVCGVKRKNAGDL